MFFLNENVLEVFNNETAKLENRVEEYNLKLVNKFQNMKATDLKETPQEEQRNSDAVMAIFKKAA